MPRKTNGWKSITFSKSVKAKQTKQVKEAAKTEHLAKVAKWFEEYNQKPG